METNKKYLPGIIGALLGGLIASIPWILMYVYGEMMLSLLAIIIALGALKGYQLLNGKIDEKLPTIISIVSIICVTISTLIIIPFLSLAKEGIEMSLENFEMLYYYEPFLNAIIKDYIISLLFTILGISGVINYIRKQVYDGKTSDIKVNLTSNPNKEQQETIKNIFTELNALDKNNAVTKEVIFDKLSSSDLKLLFNNLKYQQIIMKYKGKYYYSLENEKSFAKRFLLLFTKMMLIIILIGIAFGIIISII